MKYLILSIGLVCSLSLLAQPGNGTIQAFKAEKLFRDGKKLFEDSDYIKAIAVFDEVATLDPTHSEVFLYRAESFYALNDFERALDDYTRAVEIQPENAELRNSQGTAAARLGLYDAAASYYYEALKLDPSHPSAKDNLAQVERLRKERNPYGTNTSSNNGWVLENDNNPYDNGSNNNQYGNTNPYGTNNPYGNTNPYGNNNQYGNTNPYGSNNPTGNNPYGNNNGNYSPIGNSGSTTNPYGNNPTGTGTAPVINNAPESRNGMTFSEKNILIGQQNDKALRILRVRFTEESTIITLEVMGVGDEAFPLKLAGTKSPEAFYLADQSMRKVYRLKNVSGLAGWPNRTYDLRPRERKVISLEFERLPDGTNIFHLLEGKIDRPVSWDFYEIELKS